MIHRRRLVPALAILAWLAAPTAGIADAPGEGIAEARRAGFFSVQPDLRLCPAPHCGGVFVALLNRPRTLCADRVPQPLCHASELDLRRLALDAEARAELDQAIAAGRAVLRGRLRPGQVLDGFGPLGRFVATEAWIAATAKEPAGRWYRVTDRGLACITTPCFYLREALLNAFQARDLSALDLSPSGADEATIADTLIHLESAPILVAGHNRARPNAGPAGDGLELVARQFYRRLSPR